MAQSVLATVVESGSPLDAAARFHIETVPMAREILRGATPDALCLVFPAAGNEHHGWRLAAIQALAREAAPKRVNGVAGDDPDAIRQATDWLAGAPGITGQLLAV